MPETSRAPSDRTIPVSVIVLTLDEAEYIGDCLASLAGFAEIWVVDAGSLDGTTTICQEYTSKVVFHEFKGFSQQRQWTLEHLPLERDWVFFVDADERATPELKAEIRSLFAAQVPPAAGYFVAKKQYFWGRWLAHGECWPCYNIRLFDRSRAHLADKEVHESITVDGEKGYLRNPLIHISRATMFEAIDKLNRYTSLDAARMFKSGEELYTTASPSYSKLNQIAKGLFQCLPMPLKPGAKFCWDYIIRQGFRDGWEGFSWALLQGLYVFLAYFKSRELHKGQTQWSEEMQRAYHQDLPIATSTPAVATDKHSKPEEPELKRAV